MCKSLTSKKQTEEANEAILAEDDGQIDILIASPDAIEGLFKESLNRVSYLGIDSVEQYYTSTNTDE